MFDENSVNAEVEEVVTPQVEVEQTESVPSEVAPDAVEKTEQSPEENAKFKEIRLKYEREKQEAIDKEYSLMYGEKYGIHTKADYERAIREQREAEMLERLREEEVDPKEIYKALKENDPDYQELQKIKTESYTQNQLRELNNELKELDLDIEVKSLDDLAKLDNADKMIEHIQSGKTLAEAYFLANKKTLIQKEAEKVRNETISKIKQNGESSPGSLADTGQTTATFTREQVDNMSMEEVKKNYDLILKSMKSW